MILPLKHVIVLPEEYLTFVLIHCLVVVNKVWNVSHNLSAEGIANINATMPLLLKSHGDYGVVFRNKVGREYALYFVEVMEVGVHKVFYFLLTLKSGQRGGLADKETGRMIVSVIVQYLQEHPDYLLCYSHADNSNSNALRRLFHRWMNENSDVFHGNTEWFESTDIKDQNNSFHFMVMMNSQCSDKAMLKEFILENSYEFAMTVKKQMNLFWEIKRKHQAEP